jgi:predicted Zn-dependent peptidase
LHSFTKKFRSEFNYLDITRTLVGIDQSRHGIEIDGDGNATALLQAMEWIVSTMAAYEPSPQEMLLGIKSAAHEFENYEVTSIADQALQNTNSLLSALDHTPSESVAALKNIRSAEVLASVKRQFQRADFTIVFYGDYDEVAIQPLLVKLNSAFPARLTAAERQALHAPDYWIREPLIYWHPISEQPVASLAKAYQAPFSYTDLRKSVALSILEKALTKDVLRFNRIKRKLGYDQSATLEFGRNGPRLILSGQVADENKLATIREGWRQIIASIISGQRTFEKERDVLISQLTDSGDSYSNEVEAAFKALYYYNNPKVYELKREIVPTITDEEIVAVAREVFSGDQFLEVIIASNEPQLPETQSCAAMMYTSLSALRKRLSSR